MHIHPIEFAIRTIDNLRSHNENVELASEGPIEEGMVLFVTQSDLLADAVCGQPNVDDCLVRLRKKGIFTGAAGEVEALPTLGLLPYPYVIVAGLGHAATSDTLRTATGFAARKANALQLERLAIMLPSACDPGLAGQALAEGLLLGTYRATTYQQHPTERHDIRSVVFIAEAAAHEPLQQALRIAEAYAEGTNYARDLTNLPGNVLTPMMLATEAQKLAEHHGFPIEVLDVSALTALGMGGLLGVGQGSANPPYLITLTYQGDQESTDIIGLVGKGITFDTGGISIKPAASMEEMISDMGGAASVLGTMHIIGRLRPRCNVIAVIATAENMPSSTALKPGDLITTLSGKTIEITNTDAEGRVVLADAVTYAKQRGANRLIDIATLTGAVSVALGDFVTGAVTNDDLFLQSLLHAATLTGEKIWQLPSFPEYHKALRSDVADLKNSTKTRSAGAITGALFIGVFAEQTPWIHLDIAGTAFLSSAIGIEPKRATGVMVRTLATWVCQQDTHLTYLNTNKNNL